jgi:hypothetical protein
MYNKFIKKYKNQIVDKSVYTEKHHIIPKYLGGDNGISNLIKLTYRQHILAHLLLYRKYKNIEDLTAYKLMKSLPQERKSLICKMIGEKHKITGHIYILGNKNKETNFINFIKTKESLSLGGKIAGKIAKESGQILNIRTKESCIKGGKTSKYKSKFVMIVPDGTEFLFVFQAAKYMNISNNKLICRCKENACGYSRRLKTENELKIKFTGIV